jgi:hypothetical protein
MILHYPGNRSFAVGRVSPSRPTGELRLADPIAFRDANAGLPDCELNAGRLKNPLRPLHYEAHRHRRPEGWRSYYKDFPGFLSDPETACLVQRGSKRHPLYCVPARIVIDSFPAIILAHDLLTNSL